MLSAYFFDKVNPIVGTPHGHGLCEHSSEVLRSNNMPDRNSSLWFAICVQVMSMFSKIIFSSQWPEIKYCFREELCCTALSKPCCPRHVPKKWLCNRWAIRLIQGWYLFSASCTPQFLISPQPESLNTNTPTICPTLSTIPTSITASLPTKPTYSLSSRPPSGTPGIATMCGKQGIPPRIHDHFSNLFSSVRVLPTVVPLGAHQVSACVDFIRSLQWSFETNDTKSKGHHTSPRDGRYLLIQRGSATLTSNRKQESPLLRRPTSPSLEFQIS